MGYKQSLTRGKGGGDELSIWICVFEGDFWGVTGCGVWVYLGIMV